MFSNIHNFADLRKAYRDAARKAHPDMGVTEMFTRYLDSEIEKTGFVYEPENNESAE